MDIEKVKKEIEHNVFCNTDNFEMTISKECYKTIINALENQIPKKPYWRIEEDAKGYACPICNMGVTIDHGRIRETFCSNCGQKIDWSE